VPAQRYFISRDAHEEALPEARILYLELDEIDKEAGVARFSYEILPEGAWGEVWAGTVRGWESRLDPEVLANHAFGNLYRYGVLEIPLSEDPQVTQLEVRDMVSGEVAVYWIQTIGFDHRNFRYESFPAGAVGVETIYGYHRAVGVDDYEPVPGIADATHAHALVGNEIRVVPIQRVDGSVRMGFRSDSDTYIIYGI
jgi:hypothetical protein